MPEIGIRSYKTDDIDALRGIEHDYQTTCVWQMERSISPGDFTMRFREIRLPRTIRVEIPKVANWGDTEELAQKKGLVAVIDNEPVGYVFFDIRRDTQSAWICDLSVRKSHRRQGIGSALVLAAQDWAAKNNLKRIILEMQSKNHPAIRFAHKLGFEFCGYNDHYYANQDIALFFARYLR